MKPFKKYKVSIIKK